LKHGSEHDKKVKEIAKEKGFTLKGLAEKRLNMAYPTFLTRMKRGSFKKSVEEIDQLLAALDCTFEELKEGKSLNSAISFTLDIADNARPLSLIAA
jgi:hypothetical protein